jgi:outer membrane murein-binding lipoprotein Lpp
MTTPNPAQEISSKISTLQSKVSSLQEQVRLTRTRDALEDLQTTVGGLVQRLTSLRRRGYVFEKDLEAQAQALNRSWIQLYPSVQGQVNLQSNALMNTLQPIERQMPQLAGLAGNPDAARPLLSPLQAAVDQLEGQVEAAERMIRGMYDQFSAQLGSLKRHLDEIDFMLKNVAEATFQLLPSEGGIAAVKAEWYKAGKEQKGDPQGILFLTDQRLLFEQKEEVVTKKVLFIATEKHKVQGLQLDLPVAQVDQVTTSKAGMLKNEDHIEVRLVSGAPVERAHFHIWQDCASWQGLINRAKSRDFEAGRAVPLDQAAVDKVKAAPSQCPSCGGNINQVVLRGQDNITCEYCGYVIRL